MTNQLNIREVIREMRQGTTLAHTLAKHIVLPGDITAQELWTAKDKEGITAAEVAAIYDKLPKDFTAWDIPTSTGEHLVFTALRHKSKTPNFNQWEIMDANNEFPAASYLAVNYKTQLSEKLSVLENLSNDLVDAYGIHPLLMFLVTNVRHLTNAHYLALSPALWKKLSEITYEGVGLDFIAAFCRIRLSREAITDTQSKDAHGATKTMVSFASVWPLLKTIEEYPVLVSPPFVGPIPTEKLEEIHARYTKLVSDIKKPRFLTKPTL